VTLQRDTSSVHAAVCRTGVVCRDGGRQANVQAAAASTAVLASAGAHHGAGDAHEGGPRVSRTAFP
jgi:hypothetical protein